MYCLISSSPGSGHYSGQRNPEDGKSENIEVMITNVLKVHLQGKELGRCNANIRPKQKGHTATEHNDG